MGDLDDALRAIAGKRDAAERSDGLRAQQLALDLVEAAERALEAPPTIAETLPHVWTVDGRPQGTRHELVDHGDGTVTARELRLDHEGAATLAHPEDERRLPVATLVHLAINAIAEELARTMRPAPSTTAEIAADRVLRVAALAGVEEFEQDAALLVMTLRSQAEEIARLARKHDLLAALVAGLPDCEDMNTDGSAGSECPRKATKRVVENGGAAGTYTLDVCDSCAKGYPVADDLPYAAALRAATGLPAGGGDLDVVTAQRVAPEREPRAGKGAEGR